MLIPTNTDVCSRQFACWYLQAICPVYLGYKVLYQEKDFLTLNQPVEDRNRVLRRVKTREVSPLQLL